MLPQNILRTLGEVAPATHAGVVEQHIQTIEAFRNGRQNVPAIVFVGDVAGHGQNIRAESVQGACECLQFVGRARYQRQTCSRAGRLFSQVAADAAGRAGQQHTGPA